MDDAPIPDVDPSAPAGTIAGVTLDGVRYAVVHHDEGWVMFRDSCTHAHCSFVDDGGEIADGVVLICACHGSEFDLRDGSVRMGPATRPLELGQLRVEGDGLRASS